MVRPFKVPMGKAMGIITIILSLGLLVLYFPGMPSALIGIEWAIFSFWMLLGIVLYGYAYSKDSVKSKAYMEAEITALKELNIQWLKDNKLM